MGSTTLPDYRGMFLRGHGSQTRTDGYGTVVHSSDSLGHIQGDAIRNITGEYRIREGATASAGGAFQQESPYSTADGDGTPSPAGMSFDASRVVPTAPENRPVNVAVVYIMRVLP